MKILLIQHQNFLNGNGGTEKICCFLANGFSDLGHDVSIAINENEKGKPMFYLNENIEISNIYNANNKQITKLNYIDYNGYNPLLWLKHKLLKKQIKYKNKKIIKEAGGEEALFKTNLRNRSEVWKSFINKKNPDVIITMSINTLLEITYLQEYSIPIINSTNGRPDYDYSNILWYRSKIEMDLLKESYKSLTAIQILFNSYKEFLPEAFKGKIFTIPNPVPQVENKDVVKHTNNKDSLKIINIATLNTSCKQQDIAIEIFSKINKKFPKWELHFWGTGFDFNYLKTIISKYNLEKKVFLNGFTNAPIEKFKDADICIFPSKYEGFPLSLTEAMSVGLPCLGFLSCSGVNQLIEQDKSGFLSNNENEMENDLIKLMENSTLRQNLGDYSHQSMKKYEPKNIIEIWNNSLNILVNQSS